MQLLLKLRLNLDGGNMYTVRLLVLSEQLEHCGQGQGANSSARIEKPDISVTRCEERSYELSGC
jgi:hypothetical protein